MPHTLFPEHTPLAAPACFRRVGLRHGTAAQHVPATGGATAGLLAGGWPRGACFWHRELECPGQRKTPTPGCDGAWLCPRRIGPAVKAPRDGPPWPPVAPPAEAKAPRPHPGVWRPTLGVRPPPAPGAPGLGGLLTRVRPGEGRLGRGRRPFQLPPGRLFQEGPRHPRSHPGDVR